MKEYPNFYENIKEAEMRLKGSVVMYDGEPYYVVCLDDSKPDGIFRAYLDPVGAEEGMTIQTMLGVPYDGYIDEGKSRGQVMDKWMEANPKSTIIRKMMNSPKFNKFRPFDLGMCNAYSGVTYIERQPTRRTEQGLVANMLYQLPVKLLPTTKSSVAIELTSPAFRSCILGEYPPVDVCLENMKNPEVTNEAVAFHRLFAFVRGPIDLLFLAYKGDVVGVLPNSDLSVVRLGQKFQHTKEVVASLGIFNDIKM